MLQIEHDKEFQEDDHYSVLGIKKTATETEIKRAYRRLSKLYHPDKGGDPVRFNRITEAYQVLMDKRKRFVYDTLGFTARELEEAASDLIDHILAAYMKDMYTEKQVRSIVTALIAMEKKQHKKKVKESNAVKFVLEEIIEEIVPSNYIMEIAIKSAKDKLEAHKLGQKQMEEDIKRVSAMEALLPHLDLKTKDFPFSDFNVGGQTTNTVYTQTANIIYRAF